MTVRFWPAATVVVGGLFSGAAFLFAVERVWIWRRLAPDAFAVDFRRSIRRADPMMPILLVVCGACAVAMAVDMEGTRRSLTFAGVAVLAVIAVASVVVAEPINSQFRRRPEGEVPPGVDGLRQKWRQFHLVRATLAVVAFVLLAAAATGG